MKPNYGTVSNMYLSENKIDVLDLTADRTKGSLNFAKQSHLCPIESTRWQFGMAFYNPFKAILNPF
jgi:hypothetical protein